MTATEERVFFIWVTAQYPAVDHAVTDEEMAARSVENRGEYRALCGAVFLPAPDDRAPGQSCPVCGRVLRARVTLPTPDERLGRARGRRARHARAGWWARRQCRPVAGGSGGCDA